MPFLLRKITFNRWMPGRDSTWPPQGEVAADALKDLGTTDGKLSVWFVEDDLSNLEDVLLALAANREIIEQIDFALITLTAEFEREFKVQAQPGDTPYLKARGFHRDICELTGARLCRLADVILNSQRQRRNEAVIKGILSASVERGDVDRDLFCALLHKRLKNLDGMARRISARLEEAGCEAAKRG